MSGAGEDWADHPEHDYGWGPWVGRAARQLGLTAAWWRMTLEDGFIGPEEGDWQAGPVAVPTAALMAMLYPPTGGTAADRRGWEIRFGRRLRAMFPGARRVRRRARPRPAPLECAYVLPRLAECRETFAAWLRAEHAARAAGQGVDRWIAEQGPLRRTKAGLVPSTVRKRPKKRSGSRPPAQRFEC